MILSEAECNERLAQHAYEAAQLIPISFRPSFYCTQEFDTWWKDYYNAEILNVPSLSRNLTNIFSSIQERFKKGTTTHIKEIQAFHKYFEIAYILDDLSQTICEATITLKEIFMKKLPDLKIPLCVKHEDKYELAFKLLPTKFPRLPSANFGLAFRPSFP